MRAGKLRHRVTIEQPTESATGTGNVTRTWATFAKRHCEIEPLTGTEFFSGAALEREVSARIRMRYLPGLTAEMRIVHGSDVWDIQSIINLDTRNREIEVMVARSA